jgi:hypothetical protein
MNLPRPHRYTYFPPVKIFGRNLVPVYYSEYGPVVPLTDVIGIIGITPAKAMSIIDKNRDAIVLINAHDCKPISESKKVTATQENVCVSQEGISLLLMQIDHTQIKNPLVRERIRLSKIWLSAQVENRIKTAGQKNQTRWDSGLSKRQVKNLKEGFAKLAALEKKAEAK